MRTFDVYSRCIQKRRSRTQCEAHCGFVYIGNQYFLQKHEDREAVLGSARFRFRAEGGRTENDSRRRATLIWFHTVHLSLKPLGRYQRSELDGLAD